jgi:TfoX/Sxy family transcriptional regulator of competence genes
VLSIDSTVAISYLSLEESIYLDEKKEKDKKREARDQGNKNDSLRNSGEELK